MKGKQNAYSLQQNKKFVLDKGYSLYQSYKYPEIILEMKQIMCFLILLGSLFNSPLANFNWIKLILGISKCLHKLG